MTCPECSKTGDLSTVQCLGESTTLMGFSPYYDEKGRYHSHDPNTKKARYRCSRGHFFEERWKEPCPTCGTVGL